VIAWPSEAEVGAWLIVLIVLAVEIAVWFLVDMRK
jgi:hypothetical protein